MITTQQERAELIQFVKDHNCGGSDYNAKMERDATLLAEDGEPVSKFFLPPALHEGVAEHTVEPHRLYITGLTKRQIKEIFEDKFLGSMVWSNGSAHPTDGVEIRFTRPQQAERVPLERQLEIARIERDHAHDHYNRSVALLMGIHSLLYPPKTTTPDGRVMVFRPSSLDPHEVLQELSDRIRALPDEIAAHGITAPKEPT